jgi:hypothetical protein
MQGSDWRDLQHYSARLSSRTTQWDTSRAGCQRSSQKDRQAYKEIKEERKSTEERKTQMVPWGPEGFLECSNLKTGPLGLYHSLTLWVSLLLSVSFRLSATPSSTPLSLASHSPMVWLGVWEVFWETAANEVSAGPPSLPSIRGVAGVRVWQGLSWRDTSSHT